MSDLFYRILTFIIDAFFLLFYFTIMTVFIEVDYIAFPYNILTIYFIVATLTYPIIGIEIEDRISQTWIPNSKFSLIFAYIFAPIIYISIVL